MASESATEPSADSVTAQPAYVRLRSPGFLGLLTAQFCGMTNESAFRVTLILFLLSIVADERHEVRYASVVAAITPLPILLFSPIAGYLADRFPKHWVLLSARIPELTGMALACLGFYLHNIPLLFSALFAKATSKSFFSPAGYGIMPEILNDSQLSAANGVYELASNVASVSGSILGVYLFARFAHDLHYAGLVFLAIAGVGIASILLVPRTTTGNPQARFEWNAFNSLPRDYAEVRGNPTLLYVIIGIAWSGFLAAFFGTVLPVFGKSALGVPQERVGLLLAVVYIGLGIGAVVAGRLSNRHVEIGLVPIGSIGITIFALLLARSGGGPALPVLAVSRDVAIGLTLLGISAGVFVVPLNAMLQQRAPAGMKGRLIAFSNILRFGAVLIAAGVPWVLSNDLDWSVRQSILFVAILTLVGTAYVIFRLPDFLSRLLVWMLTNSIYRIRTVGAENQPKFGALLVCNHVSFIDSFLVSASTSRMVRFFVPRPYYRYRLLNWFFRIAHTIPMGHGDSAEQIQAALEKARDAIRHGHAVCLFAEGSITRTGNLLRFGRELEQIAAGTNCPIIPVYLDGVWGSIFSYEGGRFVFKWPRRLLQRITVVYGKPMPATARADEVRRAIQDLSVRTFAYHKEYQRPLHVEFIRSAKRRWRAILATETDGRHITFGAALTRAIALSRALWKRGGRLGDRVGILLPPGIDAMVANFAALFAGHVPVNLDAIDVAHAAVARAGIGSVLTTHQYVTAPGSAENLSPASVICFEDVQSSIGAARQIAVAIACRLIPRRLLTRVFVRGSRTDVEQVATILFSYRADDPDPPRGVMLTHHNLLSNLEALRQVFRLMHDDCILGSAPFSNSMSFVGTLLLPALTGARVAFGGKLVGSPALGAFCRANRVSLIAAGPKVMASILETVDAAEWSHPRHAVVGGGRLDDDACARFLAKFGIEPRHGYGYPECSPIISLNVPDYHHGAMHQPGTRQGTMGHPVPGVSVRVVDPSTGAMMQSGEEGILLVSGPNVMKGHVDDPEATNRVMNDGWFITGDRACVDEDGFLTITSQQA